MRLEKLDLNLLVVLEALLETHSVSATADKLNVSQPTVSASLKRLREYFNDELLTQVGRSMIPTPKGNELAPTITEMLNLARFRVIQQESFDPSQSTRRYRIAASDYIFDILLAKTIEAIHSIAPKVKFEILPLAAGMFREFDNGTIDLLFTVKQFINTQHPYEHILSDTDAVISWNQGAYAHGVNAKEFKEASFASTLFGESRRPTITDMYLNSLGIERDIAVEVSSFSALPASIVGTNRLAVMHRRHAEHFQPIYPIAINDIPINAPEISEFCQWHRLRQNDDGIRWFFEQLQSTVAAL